MEIKNKAGVAESVYARDLKSSRKKMKVFL